MNFLGTKYITEQGEKNLLAYKYVGSDSSLLYKYIFSPAAQFLVDNVIPIWLAPNLITLLGFGCTFLPHLMILAMFPSTLAGPVPSWLCYFTAIGQFVYINLDNADGKQARKTGSSSPLGLLFDHGCDALNTFISGLSLFTIVQLGNTSLAIWGDIIVMVTFFMATWEEYYVDGLHLPIINGANEGQMIIITLYIITGIFGTNVWNFKLGPVPLNEAFIYAFGIMSIATITTNIMNVHKKNREKFWNAIYNTFMILYIALTMLIVTYFSLTNVVSRHARVVIYFAGLSFGKLVGLLQATHVAHEDFKQLRKTILTTTTILNAHTLYGYSSGKLLFSEDLVLYLCFLSALVAYAHFVVNIIPQFTNALKIYVFKIGSKAVPDEIQLRGESDSLDV